MLGWHISVYRQQNDGATPAAFGAPHGARLAVWQTALGGLKWLDELVTQQKAVNLGGTGYPCEYTAMAMHIVEQLRGVPPEAKVAWGYDVGDIILPGWAGKTITDADTMNTCRPGEWLIIQAWDES